MHETLLELAQLGLLTWDEAQKVESHLLNQATFNLLPSNLQRKLYHAQALMEFDPEWPGVAMH